MMQAKFTPPAEYDGFYPKENARLSLRFLTEMTDPGYDRLPYGFIAPMNETPYAEHGREDDASLVAAWYEGVSSARELLGADEGADDEEALRRHLLDEGWDAESGLRFPVRRPWSGAMDYALLSEMAVVLSALNRAVEKSRDDEAAELRAQGLVRGLRKLATCQKARCLGFGEVGIEFPCIEFASDVYVKGAGLDPSFSTGYADSAMRCAALIDPLSQRHILTGDSAALKLAVGLANRVSQFSHFFAARNEFSGSTLYALQTACGLLKLGKITSNERYVQTAKGVYDFVRRNASAFGWLPEYINWQLPAEERCTGGCVSWMMLCAIGLADSGFNEYLDDIHRFWRNHLEESQFTDTSFLPASGNPPPPDAGHRTYRDISGRVLGAVSGCTAVNYLQFARHAAVSTYCSAAAPVAMLAAWRHVVAPAGQDGVVINFPVNFENDAVKVTVGYPNAGTVKAELKRGMKVSFRVYPWMGAFFEGKANGRPAPYERHEDFVSFEPQPAGSSVEIAHEIKSRRVMENVMGYDFYGVWRGPEMVDILPHGFPIRLYQRVTGQCKEVPEGWALNRQKNELEPVIEPASSKEKKIVRRKAPKN